MQLIVKLDQGDLKSIIRDYVTEENDGEGEPEIIFHVRKDEAGFDEVTCTIVWHGENPFLEGPGPYR